MMESTPWNTPTGLIRTFVGLSVYLSAQHELIQVRRRLPLPSGLDVEWEPPFNYHVTLRFLGKSTHEQCRQVVFGDAARNHEAMRLYEMTAVPAAPLTLQLSGLGVFPDWEQPKILWAGISGETERLTLVQSHFEQRAQRAGFAPADFDYRPHITLARFKDVTPAEAADLRVAVEGLLVPEYPDRTVSWNLKEANLYTSYRDEFSLDGYQVMYHIVGKAMLNAEYYELAQ